MKFSFSLLLVGCEDQGLKKVKCKIKGKEIFGLL